jgi:hypothetical protein
MVVRVEGIPAGLEPGTYPIRFVRINGDVAIYEYVRNPQADEHLSCMIL